MWHCELCPDLTYAEAAAVEPVATTGIVCELVWIEHQLIQLVLSVDDQRTTELVAKREVERVARGCFIARASSTCKCRGRWLW